MTSSMYQACWPFVDIFMSRQASCARADNPTELTRTRRVLANRQSARQSRMRKMQKIKLLDQLVNRLEQSIVEMQPKVCRLQGRHAREYLMVLADSINHSCLNASRGLHP